MSQQPDDLVERLRQELFGDPNWTYHQLGVWLTDNAKHIFAALATTPDHADAATITALRQRVAELERLHEAASTGVGNTDQRTA